ncbi:hypothetical protein ACO1DC_07455 [Bacillus velezensis]
MAAERLIWFITRPERDPKFHKEAIKALYKATDELKLTWSGNREVHKRYEQELADIGIKRQNISERVEDLDRAGDTWMALLRYF